MKRALVVLVAFVLFGTACGSEQPALTYGDLSISRSELIEELETQGAIADGIGTSDAAAAYLTTQIQEQAISKLAVDSGIDTEGLNTDQMFSAVVAQEIEARVPGIAEVAVSSTLCSRHILVATEEEAQSVLDALANDEDFASLAQGVSLDTGSGAAGGDLGCQPLGTFVPEFDAALIAATFGDIVGPIETQFGFHIIERLPDSVATEQAIIDAGISTAFESQDEFNAWFVEAIDIEVEVDPRYGTWDPDVLAVVPPTQDLDAPAG